MNSHGRWGRYQEQGVGGDIEAGERTGKSVRDVVCVYVCVCGMWCFFTHLRKSVLSQEKLRRLREQVRRLSGQSGT